VEHSHAEQLLEQARLAAQAELARVRSERGTAADDQSDASAEADDLIDHETGEALEELLTVRLEAIERAEARLRDGSFGHSVLSGDPIPDERLEIEPWAELTVTEQVAA
jgi:DnaK suppressor protein